MPTDSQKSWLQNYTAPRPACIPVEYINTRPTAQRNSVIPTWSLSSDAANARSFPSGDRETESRRGVPVPASIAQTPKVWSRRGPTETIATVESTSSAMRFR